MNTIDEAFYEELMYKDEERQIQQEQIRRAILSERRMNEYIARLRQRDRRHLYRANRERKQGLRDDVPVGEFYVMEK